MGKTIAFREVLTILFKHKYKVILTFLATAITVTIGTLYVPDVYEATSSLLIKFGREYIYRPTVSDSRSPSNYFNRDRIINAEIEILTSRDLLEKLVLTLGVNQLYPQLSPEREPISDHKSSPDKFVLRDVLDNLRASLAHLVQTLGVDQLYPDAAQAPPQEQSQLDEAIFALSQNLSVQAIKESNVIRVSFQHPDPQLVAAVVNLLTDLFKEKHLQIFNDSEVSTFLEDKVAAYYNTLKESQENIEDFKRKNSAFSLEEQQTILLNQRAELDNSSNATTNRILELQKKIAYLKSQTGAISDQAPLYTEPEKYEIIDQTKAELLALELEEKQLLQKYIAKHPKVVNIRKQIQSAKAFLRNQRQDRQTRVGFGQDEVYQETKKELIKSEAELQSQKAKQAALDQQMAKLDQDLQTLAPLENQFRDLNRSLATKEQNYRTSLSKLEEARLSDEMDRQKMTNIRVIQQAVVPTRPVGPGKKVKIAIGSLLGAVLGVVLAFLFEFIAQQPSTPESAERHLGLPVLVTVPDLPAIPYKTIQERRLPFLPMSSAEGADRTE